MKLTVLGSSSSGNCYLIHDHQECLIIEAGISSKTVLKALDFDISKIVGVIISHEHGDHAKFTEQYLNTAVPVHCSQGTIDGLKFKKLRRPTACRHGETFTLGGFIITPFNVEHDCNEPLGFVIDHPHTGKILFLTDTYYSKYTFDGLNHILVEANYCNHILNENTRNGEVHPVVRKRLYTSHMSINTCKNLLSANDLSQVRNIVLIHLSSKNSDEKQFKEDIQKHTGKMVSVARKGLTINLNKEGF